MKLLALLSTLLAFAIYSPPQAMETLGDDLKEFDASLRDEFLKIAQPKAFQDKTDYKTHEPAYLKEERDLIAGKKLTLAGILPFRGGDVVGDTICALTNSQWSHTGAKVVDQEGLEYCFECTGAADEILKENMWPQVQIHKLDDVVANYNGNVGYRPIHTAAENNADVTTYVHSWLGIPYEERPLDLIRSIGDWNKEEHDKSMFCSQMVALLLKKVGYLPNGPDAKLADNYIPRDFGMQESLALSGGAQLGDLIYLKGSPSKVKKHKCVLF